MDGEGGDRNNGDGVDDGSGVNNNGGADTACRDGESIVDCGADKDVVQIIVLVLLVEVVPIFACPCEMLRHSMENLFSFIKL